MRRAQEGQGDAWPSDCQDGTKPMHTQMHGQGLDTPTPRTPFGGGVCIMQSKQEHAKDEDWQDSSTTPHHQNCLLKELKDKRHYSYVCTHFICIWTHGHFHLSYISQFQPSPMAHENVCVWYGSHRYKEQFRYSEMGELFSLTVIV